MKGYIAISIADDSEFLVIVHSLAQLYERLEKTEVKAVEWGDRNHIVFHNANDTNNRHRNRTPLLYRHNYAFQLRFSYWFLLHTFF